MDIPRGPYVKYKNAATAWGWQYVFPSDRISFDPRSSRKARHHLDESGMQKAVRSAAMGLLGSQQWIAGVGPTYPIDI